MGIAEDNWTKEFKKVEFYEGFPDWMLGMIVFWLIFIVYFFITSPLSMLFTILFFAGCFYIGKFLKKIIVKRLTS